MTDLTDKTIRLYETCVNCDGVGRALVNPDHLCPICKGKGIVTTHVKFDDLAASLLPILEAAVKTAIEKVVGGAAECIQQQDQPATVPCKPCKGTGTATFSTEDKAWDCPACGGSGKVTP